MLLIEPLTTQVVDRCECGRLAAGVRALCKHLQELRTDRLGHHHASIVFSREYCAMPYDGVDIERDDTLLTSASKCVSVSAWLCAHQEQLIPVQAPLHSSGFASLPGT